MPRFVARFGLVFSMICAGPLLAPAEELKSDQLVIQAEIAREGDFMAFGFDSLWMMSDQRLVRVNPSDNSVVDIEVPGNQGPYRGIAIGEGAVWIPDAGSKSIYKIDPTSHRVTGTIAAEFFDSEGSIGVGHGAVWIVAFGEKFQPMLMRFNAETGVNEANIPVDKESIAVVVDFDAVWVTNNRKSQLYRVDPKTNTVASVIALSDWPRFLASGEGAIWVLNQGDGTVQRIDGKSGLVVASIKVGRNHTGGDIAVGGGYVWVTLKGTPVIQIDPNTNSVVRSYVGSGMGDALRYGADSLWVSGSRIFRIQAPH